MRRSTGLVIVLIIIAAAAVIIALAFKSNNTNTSSGAQNNQNTSANTSNQPSTGTINIRDMMFTPSQITVRQGGTVTWTNNDSTTHTVVDDLANAGGPHSGDIAPGQSYSFTFNKTGSFQYHCSIHPSMRGTIVVKA